MKRILVFISLFFLFGFSNPNHIEYTKIYDQNQLIAEGWKSLDGKKEAYWIYYYSNGNIKSEGHYMRDIAEKYWKFYHSNGKLAKEGHVLHNKEIDWWIFYDIHGNKIEECEFSNGKRHGYSLLYHHNNQLYKAKKYDCGIQVGEWTDYVSFKRDNG